ncbi:MAG: carboxypeptidase-like regulatory domain-containing protein, partial [Planctomycetota bacterium]
VEIDPAQWPSARFKGRVLDATRQPIAEARFSLVREKNGPSSGGILTTDATGAFDVGPYPPGRWKVQVWSMNLVQPLLVSGEVEVSAGQTFDFGDLIVE